MTVDVDESAINKSEKLWTPANIVTLVRICLVPLFVVALISPWPQWFGLPQSPVTDDVKSFIAAGIFVLISCTDWLDGYLARKRNEVTDFGKFMDPLADKILVTAALLALIELGLLPSWVVLVILAREFIVSGVRMVAATEGVVIAASWYGKFKTVFQMIAIVLFTIKDSHMIGDINAAFTDVMWIISWVVMLIALILTVVSLLDYISKARHLIGFTPKKKKSLQGTSFVSSSSNDETLLSKKESSRTNSEVLSEQAREVLDLARGQSKSIGTAESLTGGLIAAVLTSIPGSSDVVRGGVVSYVNDVKRDLLGVQDTTLAHCGAVSEETVRLMAEGARRTLMTDIAVAVTGIAGPGGFEPEKPVGTVWFGIATLNGTQVLRQVFEGDRDTVRAKTVSKALELLRAELQINAQ